MSPRPERARALAPGVPLTAGARLPLAFIGLGLVSLAASIVWLGANPHLLLLPHVHPEVVALVHLWLPGFLLSVSLGAIYQLMPVVLGAPLRVSGGALWAHLGFHGIGLMGLVGGFAAGRFEWVAVGGGAVAGGVGVLLVATWRTFCASSRRDAVAWSFPLAASWLAVTVLVGLVLALNRRAFFLPLSVIDLLRAHAHLGIAGFFLTLLQGATFQLVPMFTMADLRRPRFVGAGLALTSTGLVVLASALAYGWTGVAFAGGLALVAGIGCSGTALIATLRARRRRALEPGIQAFVAGAAALALVSAGGLALLLVPDSSPFVLRGAAAYGFLGIVGAMSLMILGMLCKIVPFLVWMKAYGPHAGRQRVPVATALGARTLEQAWLVAHLTALVLLTGAILADAPALATLGSAALALAIAAFLINAIRVLRHTWKPELDAPVPQRPAVLPT